MVLSKLVILSVELYHTAIQSRTRHQRRWLAWKKHKSKSEKWKVGSQNASLWAFVKWNLWKTRVRSRIKAGKWAVSRSPVEQREPGLNVQNECGELLIYCAQAQQQRTGPLSPDRASLYVKQTLAFLIYYLAPTLSTRFPQVHWMTRVALNWGQFEYDKTSPGRLLQTEDCLLVPCGG